MVTKIPLDLETKDDAQHLRSNLKFLLGDSHIQRFAERYETDVDIPDTVCTDKALGISPSRTSSDSIGPVLTFRNGGSFAMVHLYYEPGQGASYALGAHAGWTNHGSEDDVQEYWNALDSILDQLGALYDAYEISCPCGHSASIAGGYTEVRNAISSHYENDHEERRISTNTLVGTKVRVDSNSPESSPSAQPGPQNQPTEASNTCQ